MLNLRGSITALITPFRDGEIEFPVLEKLIQEQINSGIKNLVSCGTTAESTSLSSEEWVSCLKTCVKAAEGKASIIAGINSNSTSEVIKKANLAKSLGASAILVNPPHYNKPTKEGILNHYDQISKNTEIPIIVYNIPGRSVINLSTETIVKLSKIDNVIGIKDASNNLSNLQFIIRNAKKDFILLSGVDSSAVAFILHGGHGCISVISNLIPLFFQKVLLLALDGKFFDSIEMFKKISPLIDSLDLETNPVGIKFALNVLGKIKNELRMPLMPACISSAQKINEEMQKIEKSILEEQLKINSFKVN